MGSATALVEQEEGYGPPAPVPIYQWEAEFEQLLEIYRRQKPERVLEIGSYCGGTLYHWLQNSEPGTKVVTVDSYRIVQATGGTDNRALYPDWVPDEGVELVVIDGDSRRQKTVEEVREHGPFDWIFIDAGHRYEEVKDDWENYGVRTGKLIVVFHDILPPSRTWPSIEVAWLWKEIKQSGYRTQEIISDPAAEWGGIGIVYL